MDAVIVRPAEKSDIPQIVELMNSQYNRKKDGNYFLWQYFDSYYPTVLMCALSMSNVVGMFGLLKRELNNGLKAGQATDLLVVPEWREKGVFTNLGLTAISYFDDLDLLCVLPNVNGKNACEKAFGWQTVSKIDSVILCKILPGASYKEIDVANYEHGLETVSFKYDTATRRWRFDQHPDYQYTYVRLDAGEFSIVKIFTDPVTRIMYGDIVDFDCDLNNPDILWKLFMKSCSYLTEQGIESITSWAMPNTLLRQVVKSMGFVDLAQERYFCLKVLKKEYEYLYDLSEWHLVQADSEIY